MSNGTNLFASRLTFATSTSYALPAGDWTIGIWDNHFQGNDGWLISGPINLCYFYISGNVGTPLPQQGYYIVSGTDSAGNLFGSGTTSVNSSVGRLPLGYPGRVVGKFTPRLHIIRRNAGKSEYLVAEAGHAPVLVCSETRPFGATTGGWGLANQGGSSQLYDADLEGFFIATASVSDKDIALMAAGSKPSSVSSLSGNLALYYPLETASLSGTTNPLLLANQGSATSVGLNRKGSVSLYQDGPMLRGAVAENNTPAQVTEPTNVVALNSFQPFQVIRHLNGSANVQFTGFDYGTGTADLEIHFIDVEHGTSTAWQTLTLGSAGGGAAISATIPVPKGYWKTIEVRRVNSAGGTGNSSRPNRTWSRWAVGEVVAIWGDSIQGHMQGSSRVGIVAPNGFTAKYPTPNPYVPTNSGDTNPLCMDMWNLLTPGGVAGGSQGENELVNHLSDASHCCVGFMVSWAGATLLSIWNADGGATHYDEAKVYAMANGGLNKPNVFTWVGNLASANAHDDFYADLNLFKSHLDRDFGAGTWQLILAPMTVVYSGGSPTAFHPLRDQCRRWTRDNPQVGQFAGVFLDHNTYDGTHPDDPAWYILGPRWGNAAGYLRDQQNYADPRAGEIVNFYRSAGNLYGQVQLYAGTALSVKNPGASINGFVLSSGTFDTTISISSAVLVNGTTFKITTASALPAGALKMRYLYGRPNFSGTTAAQAGIDNALYVNAGPTNVMAVQPIWGTEANLWSLAEGTAPPPPSITAGTLSAGQVGGVYNQALAATGGLPPYTWSLVSGSLPSGLTLNSSGVITGTASRSGTASFTINVVGSDSLSSSSNFSLTILSAFAAWRGGRFTPTEISSGLANATGDFDHDGVPNLLEYAFGGNPKSPDVSLIAPVSGISGNKLQISFPCDAGCTDATYTAQVSAALDPNSWTDIARSVGGAPILPIGSLSTVSDPGTGRRTVTVTDSIQVSAGSKRFLRVNVAAP